MAITERDRRDLFDVLEQNLGPQQAETLMQLLPHQPADELVTTGHLQTEIRSQSAELRGEMADLRSELRGEMADLRSELRGEMADLRLDFEQRFTGLDTKFTRLWVTSTTANAIALVTALLT